MRAALDGTGKFIKLTANNTDTSFQVLASAAATALGIAGQSGTSTNLLQAVAGLDGTSLTVQANGGAVKTINFGGGGAQVSTMAELQSALAGTGVSASLNGGYVMLTVAACSGAMNSPTTSGSALAALSLPAAGTEYGAVNAPIPDPSRASYQAQYINLLQQIDTLATDSSYRGTNLLSGGSLSAALNEAGSSSLTIAGVTFDAARLSLAPPSGEDFQANPVIDGIVAALDAALATLRMQAATFGSSLTTLQTRAGFYQEPDRYLAERHRRPHSRRHQRGRRQRACPAGPARPAARGARGFRAERAGDPEAVPLTGREIGQNGAP